MAEEQNDVSSMTMQQKQRVASVLQGMCRDFEGWVKCEIDALGLNEAALTAALAAPAPAPETAAGKKRKSKADKEKRAPRAASAYNVFVKKINDDWKTSNPGEKPPGGPMGYASEKWTNSFMNPKSATFDKARCDVIVNKHNEDKDLAAPAEAVAETPKKKQKKEAAPAPAPESEPEASPELTEEEERARRKAKKKAKKAKRDKAKKAEVAADSSE
eukprot:TRINITY_DN26914_c0_g1_i1.p3 TRINITY_DN26914_c0_g1~~TRINITY_DN26914_c0_g1_i1.p3  ORF type:complete len:216 (+),score=82.35 TRINITY_DN26914_c0_g1_i1:164-811(+)